VEGTLLGRHPKHGVVNFRDQKGVYLLHSRDLKVVYVGQVGSGNETLFGRLKSHKKSRELWNRWQYFSWFGFRKVVGRDPKGSLAKYGGGAPNAAGTTEQFLNEIEALVIQVLEPPLNKQGPKWRENGTVPFEQEDDDKLELSDLPTLATRQAELLAQVMNLSEQLGRQESGARRR
jgi:hypothetical protein